MKTYRHRIQSVGMAVVAALSAGAVTVVSAAPPPVATLIWWTVVNNGDAVPGTGKTYNSYNQPSVNAKGLVVFRARSRGPQRESGIYTRQMPGGNINTIADLKTTVPPPNNTLYPVPGGGRTEKGGGRTEKFGTFIEFPSIPRIAIGTNALATRGNHRPVWTPGGEEEERAGTTGIYVNLNGNLITGAAKLGAFLEFPIFAVPGAASGTFFDVFPGSPAITDEDIIAFKGNYTEGDVAKTGVFYRQLADVEAGGTSHVQLIANSDTEIPGLPPGIRKKFGSFDSTSPPSAAAGKAVFVGLDNEANPSYGGIYRASLDPDKQPADLAPLTLLIGLGTRVPGLTGPSFSRLGEGLSFDGRFVAFWGAWGNSTKTVRLYCPTEGNKDRIAYCNSSASGSTQDDPAGNWYQEKPVPINQGIFVYDSQTGQIRIVARTNRDFDDFIYWNFSGRAPGTGEGGDDEDDGEPARWRSAAFVAVSGSSVAFKARTGNIDKATHVYVNPVDGIYLQRNGTSQLETVLYTTMPGTTLTLNTDEAPAGIQITELGLERDGFRGTNLVINARMGVEGGTEEDGWAGIYLTKVPNN